MTIKNGLFIQWKCSTENNTYRIGLFGKRKIFVYIVVMFFSESIFFDSHCIWKTCYQMIYRKYLRVRTFLLFAHQDTHSKSSQNLLILEQRFRNAQRVMYKINYYDCTVFKILQTFITIKNKIFFCNCLFDSHSFKWWRTAF